MIWANSSAATSLTGSVHCAGGKYYQTDDWMYGPNWAGSKTGDPEMGFGVMDGLFGGRQVRKFNKKT